MSYACLTRYSLTKELRSSIRGWLESEHNADISDKSQLIGGDKQL